MKWRNSKERELLSQGGTREQTLPSKDNQHPDLSDPLDHQTLMESTVGTGIYTLQTLDIIQFYLVYNCIREPFKVEPKSVLKRTRFSLSTLKGSLRPF